MPTTTVFVDEEGAVFSATSSLTDYGPGTITFKEIDEVYLDTMYLFGRAFDEARAAGVLRPGGGRQACGFGN
jgi:hypothetical protein